MKVLLTEGAAREFQIAAEWWRENRPLAPTLFESEFSVQVRRLADFPFSGAAVLNRRLRGLRRLSLSESRYHVFYRVDIASQKVWVVRIWHMSRRAR